MGTEEQQARTRGKCSLFLALPAVANARGQRNWTKAGQCAKEKGKMERVIREVHGSSLLIVDLLVATVLELASFPVVLEVLHLIAVLGVLVVVKGVLETTLAALAQAEDQESGDGDGAGSSGTTVDSDVSTLA